MRWGQRSQAMTEFALVAPVLLLLTFGIIDFGRALYFYQAEGNAAREGALVAARPLSLSPPPSPPGNPHPLPADADVLAAVVAHSPGVVTSFGPCPNGPIIGVPPVGQAWLFVTLPASPTGLEASPPASAPGGQPPAAANGACAAATPAGMAGASQPLQVSLVYNFVPVTPLVSAVIGNHIVFTLSVVGWTEY